MRCQYCHFRVPVVGHYDRHLRVQQPNEPVASGFTKPAVDVQELAAAKRSGSQSIAVVASGKRPKTKIQRAPTIGEKSQEVSFLCENVCGDVEDPHKLVADTGKVQQSPDCLGMQSKEQPANPKQSALLTLRAQYGNICAGKCISIYVYPILIRSGRVTEGVYRGYVGCA